MKAAAPQLSRPKVCKRHVHRSPARHAGGPAGGAVAGTRCSRMVRLQARCTISKQVLRGRAQATQAAESRGGVQGRAAAGAHRSQMVRTQGMAPNPRMMRHT